MSLAEHAQRWVFGIGAAGLLLVTSLGGTPPAPWQVFALVALVSLAGLPHGALDPLVARRAGLWRRPAGLAVFFAAYLALAGAALAFWAAVPGLFWGAFLLLSAWHFSGDWRDSVHRLPRLAAGLSIVSLPAVFHGPEVESLFAVIAGQPAAEWLVRMMAAVAPVALLGVAAAVAATARRDRATAVELAVLVAAGLALPPLLFFVVYFCGLHSPRHVLSVARDLPRRALLANGTLFTVLSVAAGAVAFALTDELLPGAAAVRVTFVGLAVLTVPHVLLVENARGVG